MLLVLLAVLACAMAQDVATVFQLARPTGLALRRDGSLVVSDESGAVLLYNGTLTQLAAGFSTPRGVAVDPFGTVYVADTMSHVIRAVAPDGTVSVLAGMVDVAGAVDGGPLDARFNSPTDVALDSLGTLYVVDSFRCAIRRVSADGHVTTIAGSIAVDSCGFANGPGNSARFNTLHGLAVDSSSYPLQGTFTLYVGDFGMLRKIVVTPAGNATVSVFAGGNLSACNVPESVQNLCGINKLALDKLGTLYVTSSGYRGAPLMSFTREGVGTVLVPYIGNGSSDYEVGFEDGPSTRALFSSPQGIAVLSNGSVYVADRLNGRVRLYRPEEPLAGSSEIPLTSSAQSIAFDVPYAQADPALVWPALQAALAAAVGEPVLVAGQAPASLGGSVFRLQVFGSSTALPSLFGSLVPHVGAGATAVLGRWLSIYGLPSRAYFANQPAGAEAAGAFALQGTATRRLQLALSNYASLSPIEVLGFERALAFLGPVSVTYTDSAAAGGTLVCFDVAAPVQLAGYFASAHVGAPAKPALFNALLAHLPSLTGAFLADQPTQAIAGIEAGPCLGAPCPAQVPTGNASVVVSVSFQAPFPDLVTADVARALGVCLCAAGNCESPVGVVLLKALSDAATFSVTADVAFVQSLEDRLMLDDTFLIAACRDPSGADFNHPPIVAAVKGVAPAQPAARGPTPPPPVASWGSMFAFSIAVDVPVAAYRASHDMFNAAVALGLKQVLQRTFVVQDHVVASASGQGTVVFVDVLQASEGDTAAGDVTGLFVTGMVSSPGKVALLQALQIEGLPISVVQYVDDLPPSSSTARRLAACGGGCHPLEPSDNCTEAVNVTIVWNGDYDAYDSPTIFPQVAYGATLAAGGGRSYRSASVAFAAGDEKVTSYQVAWCPGNAAWPHALRLVTGADPTNPPLLYFAGPAYAGLSRAARLTAFPASVPPMGLWTGAVESTKLALGIPVQTYAPNAGAFQLAVAAAVEDVLGAPRGTVFVSEWVPSGAAAVVVYFTVELPSSSSTSTLDGLNPVNIVTLGFGALFQGGSHNVIPPAGAAAGAELVNALQSYGLPLTEAFYLEPPVAVAARQLLMCSDVQGCLPPYQNLSLYDSSNQVLVWVEFFRGACDGSCGPYNFGTSAFLTAVAHSICLVLNCNYRLTVAAVTGGNFVTKADIQYGVTFYGPDADALADRLARFDAARLAAAMSSDAGLGQTVYSVSVVSTVVGEPNVALLLVPLFVLLALLVPCLLLFFLSRRN